MRVSITKKITDSSLFKQQLLLWSQQFREVVFLDSNQYPQQYSSFDSLMAVDALTSIQTDTKNAFEDLHQYQSQTKDWLFGYLSYDLKNDTERLKSSNFDGLQFPDLFFFQPKKIISITENQVEFQYLNMCDDEIETDFDEIIQIEIYSESNQNPIEINQRISKESYIDKVTKMLAHIQQGDIYEANFCMEFFAENVIINPISVYQKLDSISEPPFAVFLKNNKHFLLSASPERYLRRQENKIISQPIKGTSKRFDDSVKDNQSKIDLENDPKERSENIMIVDLVRNDLSKTAIKNSVNVEELCQVYSFKQVHQMISTIVSEVLHTNSSVEVLKTTFPMGSMTGAPKISAMQIIENLEETKRGLYSGAVGYFEPNGNFDFNVVIRSVLYNQSNKYVSFSVGSAITAASKPDLEYEECLLKAQAMFDSLQNS